LDETTKEIVERLRAATKADEANQTPRPDTTRAMIISDDRWIAADIITSLSERVGELETHVATIGEATDYWEKTRGGSIEEAAELLGLMTKVADRFVRWK